MKWWNEQLLPKLFNSSIIIMDNAAYHIVYGLNVCKVHKMKKQDCIDYLQSQTMSALKLKSFVKLYIKEQMPIEVVRTAAECPL